MVLLGRWLCWQAAFRRYMHTSGPTTKSTLVKLGQHGKTANENISLTSCGSLMLLIVSLKTSFSVVQSLFSVLCWISELACLSSHGNMGQQCLVMLYMGEEGKKDQWVLFNQWTSVKYHKCLRVSECRCVKVTISPRRSSKHAVITLLSQKVSLLIHVRKKKDSGAFMPYL